MFLLQVTSSAVFNLELIQFNNDNGLLDDGSCCSGQLIDDICTEQCRTYLRICFKHFQRQITSDSCTYGEYTTLVIGNNSFQFPSKRESFTNPLAFPIDFAWKVSGEVKLNVLSSCAV